MGGESAAGRLDVRLTEPYIVELRPVGFVRREEFRAGLRVLEDTFARDAGPYHLVWDATALEGYEPGNPARWARWLAPRLAYFRGVVTVTKSPALSAVVRAMKIMVPGLPHVAFTSRAEALAHLRSLPVSEPRAVPPRASAAARGAARR